MLALDPVAGGEAIFAPAMKFLVRGLGVEPLTSATTVDEAP